MFSEVTSEFLTIDSKYNKLIQVLALSGTVYDSTLMGEGIGNEIEVFMGETNCKIIFSFSNVYVFFVCMKRGSSLQFVA